jgi:CBS domain containing-hemolysin-like protein
VPTGSMVSDAVEIMAERKISEIPVVDAAGKPIGLIDITDIVALYPEGDFGGIRAGGSAPAAHTGQPPRPKNPAFVRTALRPETSLPESSQPGTDR